MPATLSPWTVVVTSHNRQEVARSALRAGIPIQIGRAPDCTIMLTAMNVSRYHGRIELAASGIPTYVADANAPALVDGDPVTGPTPLGERTLLEIAGFSVTLQRSRTVVTPPPKPAGGEASADGGIETLLDRHIQGVRLHRNVNQQDHKARDQQWEEDWRWVIAQLKVIKSRYGSHPGIIDFGVSKDEREAVVKVRDSNPRGYAYYCLSHMHPEGKFPNLQAVWLRELGSQDESFTEPKKGLEELMLRLASRLA